MSTQLRVSSNYGVRGEREEEEKEEKEEEQEEEQEEQEKEKGKGKRRVKSGAMTRKEEGKGDEDGRERGESFCVK
jgi:hypothetical protein